MNGFALIIPSGIFYNNTINILDPGTVINLEAAVNEMNDLGSHNISINEDNYRISDRASICFPFHALQDEYEEERLLSQFFVIKLVLNHLLLNIIKSIIGDFLNR